MSDGFGQRYQSDTRDEGASDKDSIDREKDVNNNSTSGGEMEVKNQFNGSPGLVRRRNRHKDENVKKTLLSLTESLIEALRTTSEQEGKSASLLAQEVLSSDPRIAEHLKI